MTSTSPSSLASAVDRSVYQLRPQTTNDAWGGDETVTLATVDDNLDIRIEWSGGKSNDWDIWCFDPDATFDVGDILLVEDPDMLMALVVVRSSSLTTLRTKAFHHWEILCEEHELSVAEIRSEAGI
jgi:hypothetical protein